MSALEQFDIAALAAQRADQLSGGQQQRVAIARALVQEPELILADEPIASLDPRNTRIVMDALLRINKHFGITVICNLHSLDIARSYCDRLIGMAGGRLVFDGAPAELTDAAARELYGLEADDVLDATPRAGGRARKGSGAGRGGGGVTLAVARACETGAVPDQTANRRLVMPNRRMLVLAAGAFALCVGVATCAELESRSIPSWCSPRCRTRTPPARRTAGRR